MQDSPIRYAETIANILKDLPYATADAALKIARNILDYTVTAAGRDYLAHRADQEVCAPEPSVQDILKILR